jgi:hypoxanthine-DNA glycosylase
MPIESVVHPFAPIGGERSRVLILGTMPSVQSRKAAFYYGHPRNRFWHMVSACLNEPPPNSVAEKTRLLLDNGIALWDVLASCEITASDDSSIHQPICNDIAAFIDGKPIAKILCNGRKAFQLYERYRAARLPVVCMPSTSPANAAWGIERLIEAWRAEIVGINGMPI